MNHGKRAISQILTMDPLLLSKCSTTRGIIQNIKSTSILAWTLLESQRQLLQVNPYLKSVLTLCSKRTINATLIPQDLTRRFLSAMKRRNRASTKSHRSSMHLKVARKLQTTNPLALLCVPLTFWISNKNWLQPLKFRRNNCSSQQWEYRRNCRYRKTRNILCKTYQK